MNIEKTPQYKAWHSGIQDEINFWTSWFVTKGLSWPSEYAFRLEPESALQQRPAALLPDIYRVRILDVGAGPLTFLGKRYPFKEIVIEAVDPLADVYDHILNHFDIKPIVRTAKCAAEELSARFPPNSFDLVYARNCLDHGIDPEIAISEMLRVVKNDCFILLEHRPQEGEAESYAGMHQWNFDVDEVGQFVAWSKFKRVNVTKMLSGVARVECERTTDDGTWIVVRIKKSAA